MKIEKIIDKRYAQLVEIGVGGMAVVYKALDQQLNREVAIKVILDDLASKPKFKTRFEREVMSLASLSHPNIVPIYDYRSTDLGTYYVMAFLDGKMLSEFITNTIPKPDLVKSVMLGMLAAIEYSHSKDIIHRDLKPENIIIDKNNNVYLTDFGLVQFEDDNVTKLTQQGMFLGTPAYASPEQIEGSEIRKTSDIYSLGIVLYQMLTGRVPFTGNMNSIISGHLSKPLPKINIEDVDVSLRQFLPIVQKMLRKKPEDRFQSCEEILNNIDFEKNHKKQSQMKCKKCGAQIKKGGVFCGVCGEKILLKENKVDEQKNVNNKKESVLNKEKETIKNREEKDFLSEHSLLEIILNLPKLKRDLKENEELLNRLNGTQSDISLSLYADSEQKYKENIAMLNSQIDELTKKAQLRIVEIDKDVNSLDENLNVCLKELESVAIVLQQVDSTDVEYNNKYKNLKKRASTIRKNLGLLNNESKEIKFLLSNEAIGNAKVKILETKRNFSKILKKYLHVILIFISVFALILFFTSADNLMNDFASSDKSVIRVVSVTSSSYQKSSSNFSYLPHNLIDKKLSTSWQEGVPGIGFGQWIEFRLNRNSIVGEIRIIGGFQWKTPENGDLYEKNARPIKIKVQYKQRKNDRFPVSKIINLEDKKGFQSFPVAGINARYIRLIILEAKKGSYWTNDTAITEVAFLGS